MRFYKNEKRGELEADSRANWGQLPQEIEEFLCAALKYIATAYPDESLPAIVFEVWPETGTIYIYDSIFGERLLERNERITTVFNSKAMMEKYSDLKDTFDPEFFETIWNSVRNCVAKGPVADVLRDQFNSKPRMIGMPFDEYNRVIDIETGEKIDLPS